MSDMISENQLDNLLSAEDPTAAGAGAIDDEAGGGEPAGTDYNRLTNAFDFLGTKARDVLSTVLNRQVLVNAESCGKASASSASGNLKGELLSLGIPLSGGIAGTMTAVMSKTDVAMLSDLMMLGDGTAPYSDDHKDAIAELFNQIMGSYCGAASQNLPQSVAAGTIEVKEFSFAQPTFDLASSDMAMLRLDVKGMTQSSFIVFSSEAMAKGLIAAMPPSEDAVPVVGKGMGDEDIGSGGVGLSDAELNDLAGVTGAGAGAEATTQFAETGFSAPRAAAAPSENVEMLLDVELDISIELGRTNLSIKRILELAPGSVVELDKMAGEPVDLVVNGKVVAKGEVVVVDENFGVRIVSLVSAEERIRSLR